MEKLNELRTFLQESWLEVRHKVTWPTKQEVWGTTMVVLFTTVAFAVLLGVVDHFMATAMKKIFDTMRGTDVAALLPALADAIG
jgi:preprotein translocase subunit SecE